MQPLTYDLKKKLQGLYDGAISAQKTKKKKEEKKVETYEMHNSKNFYMEKHSLKKTFFIFSVHPKNKQSK